MAATGGTFTAWLNYLDVAVNVDGDYDPSQSRTALGTGTLDLRAMRGVALNVVTARVGQCGTGNVYLPSGSVTAAVLRVGTSGGASVLDLRDTRFAVGTLFTNGPLGTVRTHVSGASCGLDVTNGAAGSFGISTGGVYNLVFEQTPPIDQDCWGLRLAGDWQALLTAYTSDGRITWDLSAVTPARRAAFGVYYRNGFTWVGLSHAPNGVIVQLR